MHVGQQDRSKRYGNLQKKLVWGHDTAEWISTETHAIMRLTQLFIVLEWTHSTHPRQSVSCSETIVYMQRSPADPSQVKPSQWYLQMQALMSLYVRIFLETLLQLFNNFQYHIQIDGHPVLLRRFFSWFRRRDINDFTYTSLRVFVWRQESNVTLCRCPNWTSSSNWSSTWML